MSSTPPPAAAPTAPRPENLLVNLLCNVAAPALILAQLSSEGRLGPVGALVVALVFPLAYGAWDLVARRKWNFFSILGVVSVLLTGGLGLMKVAGFWFAVKEAAIPAVFGVAVIGSTWTRTPLVRTLLYSDKVLDTARVQRALAERGRERDFERLLDRATWLLAGSFFLSAALNFGLARYLLRSPAGTPEFNAELGRMTALSWPVIVLPSLAVTIAALAYLLGGIRRLTGLTLEDVFHQPPSKG